MIPSWQIRDTIPQIVTRLNGKWEYKKMYNTIYFNKLTSAQLFLTIAKDRKVFYKGIDCTENSVDKYAVHITKEMYKF